VRGLGLELLPRLTVPANCANLSLVRIDDHASTNSVEIPAQSEANNSSVNLDFDSLLSSDSKVSSGGKHDSLEINRFRLHNISSKLMNQNTLLNLLSCHGAVASLHLDKITQSAVVMFSEKAECLRAQINLHGLELLDCQLSVMPLNKDSLLPQTLNIGMGKSQPHFGEPIGEGDPIKISICRTFWVQSNIIRIENLPPSCTPLILFNIINQIHEPRKMTRLTEKAINSSVVSVEFSTPLMSLEVFLVLNGKRIDGNAIKVSIVSDMHFT